MKKSFFRSLLLALTLGLSTAASAADGVLLSARVPEANQCHLKFPAIREDTLYSERPVLKDPSEGDIIDFYGPCDYDPLGKEAVQAQRYDFQLRSRPKGD